YGIFRATVDRPGKERLAAVDRGKANRTEQQIESEKIVDLISARSKLKLAGCWRKAIQEGWQIDFKVSLEARLSRTKNSRHQPPKATICQDAVIPQAVIEIPFDLLRRIFSLTTIPRWPVETYMPCLCVSYCSCMRPECGIVASSAESRLQIRGA